MMSGFAFTTASAATPALANDENRKSATKKQPARKKRNQPGQPAPDAEVLALSPRTLLATNRFVCEICNKGFQRDQNLQLHRRGHNLPWKLRKRTAGKEARKRVYVCPEPTCVHHHPSRALGDLTGIKKHFSRKHGEKRWECDRCAKRYAVYSDWKAHFKTCGTREYKCECGTLFSRRDSYVSHRSFCDALTLESMTVPPPIITTDPITTDPIITDPSFETEEATAELNALNLSDTSTQMFEALMKYGYGYEVPPQDMAAVGQQENNLSLWLGGNTHDLNAPPVAMATNGPNLMSGASVNLPELLQMAAANTGFGSPSSIMNHRGGRLMQEPMDKSGTSLSLSTMSFAFTEANNINGKNSAPDQGLVTSLYNTNGVYRQPDAPPPAHLSTTALTLKGTQVSATVNDPAASSVIPGLTSSLNNMQCRRESGIEFQLFGQEKEMSRGFQDLMVSPFPSLGMLAGRENNASMEMPCYEYHRALGPPPLQQQELPSLPTRDFLGLGGGGGGQLGLEQELARYASMCSRMYLGDSFQKIAQHANWSMPLVVVIIYEIISQTAHICGRTQL